MLKKGQIFVLTKGSTLLLDAKYRFLNHIERRTEHVLPAISAEAVRWCVNRGTNTVYVGDPSEVRDKDCGRKHNHDPLTRVPRGRWTFGKLRRLPEYKLKRHGIKLMSVDERGTSGTCPACTVYTKQSGRTCKCGNEDCGFAGGHRDVVGSSGILDKSINGSFTKDGSFRQRWHIPGPGCRRRKRNPPDV